MHHIFYEHFWRAKTFPNIDIKFIRFSTKIKNIFYLNEMENFDFALNTAKSFEVSHDDIKKVDDNFFFWFRYHNLWRVALKFKYFRLHFYSKLACWMWVQIVQLSACHAKSGDQRLINQARDGINSSESSCNLKGEII